MKFRVTRQWNDITDASSARVTKDRSGRWFVSFTYPAPNLEREPTNKTVGLDMGVTHTITKSNGQFLDMPKLLSEGEQQRKRRLQRKLARQVKGSSRRKSTKAALAKLSAKETDRRKDWIEKTTTDLVRSYDLIALENLKIKNMTKSAKGTIQNPGKNVAQKAGLNRSILEQSWGMFRQRLTDKATNATTPVEIITINPAYTSMCCSKCGHTDKRNRESQADFYCQACGYTDNADVNAAKNIISTAVGHTVFRRGGTPHARSNKTQHSDSLKRQPAEVV